MTFSILGICRKTRRMGLAQATSTPSIGQRCADFAHGFGIVAIQALADRDGMLCAVNELQQGRTSAEVLDQLKSRDQLFEWRQFAILGLDGDSAVYTGTRTHGWAGEIVKTDHIATANYTVGPEIVRDMSAAFENTPDLSLEDRLMLALEAGRDAGGEPFGQRSSALVLHDPRDSLPIMNLRIDVNAEPVGALRTYFDWYKPCVQYFIDRRYHPDMALGFKDFLDQNSLPWVPE